MSHFAIRSTVLLIGFYIGWWATIWGVGKGWNWLALVFALSMWSVQAIWSGGRPRESIFIGVLAIIGFFTESCLIQIGLFSIEPPHEVAPLWMVSLWIMFASTFEGMTSNFEKRQYLLIIGAAIGGPFSYYAGEKLGLIRYSRPLGMSLLIHGVLWALLVPSLIWLRKQILSWRLARVS